MSDSLRRIQGENEQLQQLVKQLESDLVIKSKFIESLRIELQELSEHVLRLVEAQSKEGPEFLLMSLEDNEWGIN